MESRQHAAKDTTKSLVDLVAEETIPWRCRLLLGVRRGHVTAERTRRCGGATSVSDGRRRGSCRGGCGVRGGAAPCTSSSCSSSRGPCSICTPAGEGAVAWWDEPIEALIISSLPSWTAFSPLQSLHMLLPSPPSPPGRVVTTTGSVLSPRSIAERKLLPRLPFTVSPCRLHVCPRCLPWHASQVGSGDMALGKEVEVNLLGESAICACRPGKTLPPPDGPSESGRCWRAS